MRRPKLGLWSQSSRVLVRTNPYNKAPAGTGLYHGLRGPTFAWTLASAASGLSRAFHAKVRGEKRYRAEVSFDDGLNVWGSQ